LKLFLPRQHRDGCIYFQTDWSFVPPGVAAATVPADAPKLRLRLIGHVPGLRDWRDLENLFLGYHERIDGNETSDTRGPDMWIWPPGETKPLRFGHWETDLKFGERHGHEFDFTLEALIRSERASKYRMDLHMKEFFQQPVPADWEQPEWINEVDDELSFEGRVEFREILCSTPINCAPWNNSALAASTTSATPANIIPKTTSAAPAASWCSPCPPAEACGKRDETRIRPQLTRIRIHRPPPVAMQHDGIRLQLAGKKIEPIVTPRAAMMTARFSLSAVKRGRGQG
jgi:hypothetical protein